MMPRLEVSPERSSGNRASLDLRYLWHRAREVPRQTLTRYRKLGKKGKTIVWGIAAAHLLGLLLVIIITPTRIGQGLNTLALRVKDMGWKGVVLCNVFAMLSSHPPLFGFMPTLTLIGFIYGVWPGFLIAFIASNLGAGFGFLSVRRFFLHLIKKNDKFEAFGHVMRAKGLSLIIMIRYCPIPWAVGNGFFASVESVKFWQFMISNVAITPRLLVPVFIGSRLTSLTSKTPPDPLHFWINLISIGISGAISVTTGIVIYRLTLEQMRKLDREGAGLGDGELAAEALEEGALLGDYEDGGDDEAELLTGVASPRDRDSVRSLGEIDGAGIIRRSNSNDANGRENIA